MKDNQFITDYMVQYFDEVSPRDFYRAIFPAGELEKKGIQEKGKYTGVAVELIQPKDGEQTIKRYTITDDLEMIDQLQESDNFIIISPISYAGKSRKSENARYIYALAIDLDGVDDQQHLTDLFHQINHEVIPRPTYVVTSGSGLHLYYVFKQPIPCFKNITQDLGQFKNVITRRIWTKYITTLYEKVQYQSLFQGFRMVGGVTKNGNRTRAFEVGDRVDIDYLNQFFMPDKQMKVQLNKSKMTLDQAKQKYPEWYEERIVKGRKRNTWTCKKDLYEWWKKKIMSEASEGHRYFAVMCLAIYAKKCGVDYDELAKDAFSLVDMLDVLTTDEDNHFTREDVLAGLELYNDGYITFPIHSIVDATNIPIQKNKRNGRKKSVHIAMVNAMKKIAKESGEPIGRPEGSGTKQIDTIMWYAHHPEGRVSECSKDMGISRTTAYKYRTKKAVMQFDPGRPKGSGTKKEIVETWQREHPNGRKIECIRDLKISKATVYKYWT